MYKKIIPIVTIVLAIGLFAFIVRVQKQESEADIQRRELYEQRRPLAVKQEQLEQELEILENAYEKSKAPNGVVQVIFTDLDEQVYTKCFPIMNEHKYKGILALSPTQLPGETGCMTLEQFRELSEAGWEICITWQKDQNVAEWWPSLKNKLTVLGIEQGTVVYFPRDTYRAELDVTIQELGFSIAVINRKEPESPLQLQHEEGVWHLGAVGLMSAKPRLWLREAVAQEANLTFLVGFQDEEELYNERSFRSMLNCFAEYEATEELITAHYDAAREHYRSRIAGVAPEVESEYQEKKATLEKELMDVNKQLEEIDAKY